MKRKLIEVAMPLDTINKLSIEEKDIHTGHPANLHMWWARRPLAACRAVLFASVIDDPGNHLPPIEAKRERQRLFALIDRMCRWDNAVDPKTLKEVRAEIMKATGGTRLTVADPFCGGGAIPIEAQRLGFDAVGSDLNPVAVMVTKTMTELVPRVIGHKPVHPGAKLSTESDWSKAQGLIEDVAFYGRWMREQAYARIGRYFPQSIGGGEVVSWLWARAIACPSPACRTLMPLVPSYAVSTHAGREAYVKPVVDAKAKRVRFEIVAKDPKADPTVGRRGGKCLACGSAIPLAYIRAEAVAGRMTYELLAIAVDTKSGREYREAVAEQVQLAAKAEPSWVPDTVLPPRALGFRVQAYGMTRHADLFTPRQMLSISTFSDLVPEAYAKILDDSKRDAEYAQVVAVILAFGVDRLAQSNNTLVRWLVRKSGTSKGAAAFDRQTVPMVWSFAEGSVFGSSVGSWDVSLKNPLTALKSVPPGVRPGTVLQADATTGAGIPLGAMVSTDPPYFDNIGYGNLSDFFYIWMRRSLSNFWPDLFSTLLVPKNQELIADPGRFDGNAQAAEDHFLEGLRGAFSQVRAKANPEYPVTIWYAFKQSEEDEDLDTDEVLVASTGWETMLQGLIDAGFQVAGTWPMRTERKSRMNAVETNALASSIVLVCRPRPANAPMATRREFSNYLRRELPEALRQLQEGNVAPVDLAQASIGPGIAVFSRYSRVLEADGSGMSVRTALQLINQELESYLKEEHGDLDSESQFCVAWFEQYGVAAGPFGEADVLARAKNASVEGLARQGLVDSRGGKVLLSPRAAFTGQWEPDSERKLTVWECAQRLSQAYSEAGESEAAELSTKLGVGRSDDAKALAYRLYSICERKGWTDEGRAWNDLISVWNEIQQKAAGLAGTAPQRTLDVGVETKSTSQGRKKK